MKFDEVVGVLMLIAMASVVAYLYGHGHGYELGLKEGEANAIFNKNGIIIRHG